MAPDFKYQIEYNGKRMPKVLLPGKELDEELLWWERAHPTDQVSIVRVNPPNTTREDRQ